MSKKPKEVTIDQWLQNSLEQIRWVENYFVKKGITLAIRTDLNDYDNLKEGLTFLSYQEGSWNEFFTQMQAAWYSYQYNLKNKKKQISFYLDKEVTLKLKRLAKQLGRTQKETITILINEGFDIREASNKELEAKKVELELKYDKSKPVKQNPLYEYLSLEKKWKELEDRFSKQKVVLNSILDETALLKAKAEYKNWNELNDDEKSTILQNQIIKYKKHYLKED